MQGLRTVNLAHDPLGKGHFYSNRRGLKMNNASTASELAMKPFAGSEATRGRGINTGTKKTHATVHASLLIQHLYYWRR